MSALATRMLEAADTIQTFNARYGFGPAFPWTADSLRHEAAVVADEEHEQSHA